MKKFDKWLETKEFYDPFCCAIMARAAWKAALEEVYKQLDYSEEHETIKDWIEKELNDDNN